MEEVKKRLKMLLGEPGAIKIRKTNVNTKAKQIKKNNKK